MGLDWHSYVKATQKDKEEYVRKYYAEGLANGAKLEDLIKEHAPDRAEPCAHVGAPRMHTLPDFKELCEQRLAHQKEGVEELKKRKAEGQPVNETFIAHWENRTLEEVMEESGPKFSCDNCPLLKALNGADSATNMFLGITVSSCDFRGKRIGRNGLVADELQNEAYLEHQDEELLAYAGALEADLERQREAGNLEKAPYEEYSAEFDKDKIAQMFGSKQTREEYESTPHWHEATMKEAIHWLRTMHKFGVRMDTSY